MNNKHSNTNPFDIQRIKSLSSGRETDILQTVAGINGDLLDGKHHPCPHPNCSDGGGEDRFRHMIERQPGVVHCNQCFNKNNGDFIAAVKWMRGCDLPEALKLIADYLGVKSGITKQQGGKKVTAKGKTKKPAFDFKNIIAEYEYTDEKGRLIYKVLRDSHKGFIQGRPDPDKPGKFIWNLKGVERVPYQLPRLVHKNLANGLKTIFIVEGEKDADNLNQLFLQSQTVGVVATTSGSSQSADLWPGFIEKYHLTDKQVVVLPDTDEPGLSFGQEVCRSFVNAGCEFVKLVKIPFPYSDISDLIEARQESGKKPEEIFQGLKSLCQGFDCITPETVSGWPICKKAIAGQKEEKETMEPCPVDVLPNKLQQFVRETSLSTQVDPAFVLSFVLSAISGVMGRLFRLRLKKGYYEIPSIWTVVVASSGTGKTPALNAVLEPIRRFQTEADESYKESLAEYEQEMEGFNEQKRSRKRNKSQEPPLEKPVEPIPEQFLVDSVTTEAVTEIMEQNPHGVLLPQDELSGFLNGFDVYRSGSGGKDLPFWLSVFSGVPVRHNRKTGRKVISAPTPAVAICGGVQPGILSRTLVENEHYFDSGLAARFLFVMPEYNPVSWSEYEVSEYAEREYLKIIETLFALRKSGDVPANQPITFSLSSVAKQIFVSFVKANAVEQIDIDAEAGRATFAKFPTYAARLALVLHVIQCIESMDDEQPVFSQDVSSEAMASAIRIVEWFKGESLRVLNAMTIPEEGKKGISVDREAMKILQKINDNGGSITARDLVRSQKQYMKEGGTEAAEKKLQEMVKDKVLVSVFEQGENGRGKIVFRLPSSVDIDTTSKNPEKNEGSVNVNGKENIENTFFDQEPPAVSLKRKPVKKKTDPESKKEEPKHEQTTLFD